MDRLRLSISSIGADAFLVTHLPNILYLCGFTGSAGILVVGPDWATLYTDSRYTFQARTEVCGAAIRIARQGLLKSLGVDLHRRRRVRLAYTAGQMTVAQKSALQRALGPKVRWVEGGPAVEQLRAVKDASEVGVMRQAAAIASEVFEEVLGYLKSGVSENDVAAEIEYRMRRRGSSGAAFETIVASGPRSAWAHARPTPKRLGKNELVILDLGAILKGYCSDMTRTVFLGSVSSKVRRMYAAVREAQESAKGAIRPGARAMEVDAAARNVLRRRRLARYFTHSTGHGLGLEVHEIPRLGRGERMRLQEGMVLTVEPGVYVQGQGGIRIEDDVVVTSKGALTLTSATREFLEL